MIYESEAEDVVLGAALWSQRDAAKAIAALEPSDFSPPNRGIFAAIRSLFLDEGGLTPVLVLDRMRAEGSLTKTSRDRIMGILHHAGSGIYLGQHIALVKNRAHARDLGSLMSEDPSEMSDEEIAEMATETEGLLHRMSHRSLTGAQDIKGRVDAELRAMEETHDETPGISSGFKKLDSDLNGFRPEQLILVGGRPGHGKSALMTAFALAAAKAGRQVVYFTLEMSAGELMDRMIAVEAKVSLSGIIRKKLEDDEWDRLTKAGAAIDALPIAIDARAELTVSQIIAECRRRSALKGLDLVIVDYIQLVKPTNQRDNRNEQIGQISRALKMLAKQERVPVIAGSQLNRGIESRTGKARKPRMDDLRDSGSLEQDSDVVLFVHRPDQAKQETDLLIAKQRQGEAGITIRMLFQGEFTRFREQGKYLFGGDE